MRTHTLTTALFHVKLAQRVGSYSLELTTLRTAHSHHYWLNSNGIAEVALDLLHDGGKRYTNERFNTTWTVTFPEPTKPGSTNSTQAKSLP